MARPLARRSGRRARCGCFTPRVTQILPELLPILRQVAQDVPPVLQVLPQLASVVAELLAGILHLRAVRLDRRLVGAALQVVPELLPAVAHVADVAADLAVVVTDLLVLRPQALAIPLEVLKVGLHLGRRLRKPRRRRPLGRPGRACWASAHRPRQAHGGRRALVIAQVAQVLPELLPVAGEVLADIAAIAEVLPELAPVVPHLLAGILHLRAVRLDRPLVGAALQVVPELLPAVAHVADVAADLAAVVADLLVDVTEPLPVPLDLLEVVAGLGRRAGGSPCRGTGLTRTADTLAGPPKARTTRAPGGDSLEAGSGAAGTAALEVPPLRGPARAPPTSGALGEGRRNRDGDQRRPGHYECYPTGSAHR